MPRVAFHIDTSHLIWSSNQMARSYMTYHNNSYETEDFYEDITYDVEKIFDTSNYDVERPLAIRIIKKILLRWKMN